MSEIRFPYKKADINRLFPGKSIPVPDEARAARIEKIKKGIYNQVFMDNVCIGLENSEHFSVAGSSLLCADKTDVCSWIVKSKYITLRKAQNNHIILALPEDYDRAPSILKEGVEQSLEYIGVLNLVPANIENSSSSLEEGSYRCWRTTNTYTGVFNILLDDKEIIEEEVQR